MKNKTIKINNVEHMSYPEESVLSCDGCHFEHMSHDCGVAYSLVGGCDNAGIIWKKVEGHRHAKLMMEYAQDCLVNSRAYEKWEFSRKDILPIEWESLNCHPMWDPRYDYRRKTPTITIGGVDTPKPETQPLAHETTYWVTMPVSGSQMLWRGDSYDFAVLNAGLVHLSKEAAEKHAEVLYGYNKKCCGL